MAEEEGVEVEKKRRKSVVDSFFKLIKYSQAFDSNEWQILKFIIIKSEWLIVCGNMKGNLYRYYIKNKEQCILANLAFLFTFSSFNKII